MSSGTLSELSPGESQSLHFENPHIQIEFLWIEYNMKDRWRRMYLQYKGTSSGYSIRVWFDWLVVFVCSWGWDGSEEGNT